MKERDPDIFVMSWHSCKGSEILWRGIPAIRATPSIAKPSDILFSMYFANPCLTLYNLYHLQRTYNNNMEIFLPHAYGWVRHRGASAPAGCNGGDRLGPHTDRWGIPSAVGAVDLADDGTAVENTVAGSPAAVIDVAWRRCDAGLRSCGGGPRSRLHRNLVNCHLTPTNRVHWQWAVPENYIKTFFFLEIYPVSFIISGAKRILMEIWTTNEYNKTFYCLSIKFQ